MEDSGSQKTRKDANADKKLTRSDLTGLGIRNAGGELNRKAYPRTYKTHVEGQSREETVKAHLLDWVSLHGELPNYASRAYPELLDDREFIRELHKAYENSNQTDPMDFHLWENWKAEGYYKMTDAELAQIINEKFEENFKPRTLAKRLERLGLSFKRPYGPRPRGE